MEKVTREELVSEMKSTEIGGHFYIITNEDNKYEIGCATAYIGGDSMEGSLISDLLGNIAYSNREKMADDIIDFLAEDDIYIVEIDY